jgi:hypothetical protein
MVLLRGGGRSCGLEQSADALDLSQRQRQLTHLDVDTVAITNWQIRKLSAFQGTQLPGVVFGEAQ